MKCTTKIQLLQFNGNFCVNTSMSRKAGFYCNIPAGGLAFPDNWGELLYFVAPGPSFSIWTTVKVVDFRIILSPTRHKFQCATAVIFWHTGFSKYERLISEKWWKCMGLEQGTRKPLLVLALFRAWLNSRFVFYGKPNLIKL